MPRYAPRVRRPRAVLDDFCSWDTDEAHKGSIEVHEPRQDEPTETGLYDLHGNPLMRLPEPRRPIGFLADLDAD